MSQLQSFRHDLARYELLPWITNQRVIVGVSGGPDSLCLLHLLYQLSSTFNVSLHVATLDHGLRGEASASDADFVAQTAQDWQLPVHLARRDVARIAQEYQFGIEEAARRTRYTFLAQVALNVKARVIAVAHNADDQAETILMHLIRGTGLAGLRGMQPTSHLSASHLLPSYQLPQPLYLIRPLLGTPRSQIEAYCHEQQLNPRQDASNTDPAYLRNRLRHEIMPLLAEINPNIITALTQTGYLLSADHQHLQHLIQSALNAMIRQQTGEVIRLDRPLYRRSSFSSALRLGILREAVRRLLPAGQEVGLPPLEQAVTIALQGETGSEAHLPGKVVMRVEHDHLLLYKGELPPLEGDSPQIPAASRIHVRTPGWTMIPESDWRLHTEILQTPSQDGLTQLLEQDSPHTVVLSVPAQAKIMLRSREPGDRFAPQGMNTHHQKLSDYFTNEKIPAHERAQIPLLIIDGEIACIFLGKQCRISHHFAVGPDSQRILRFRWERI